MKNWLNEDRDHRNVDCAVKRDNTNYTHFVRGIRIFVYRDNIFICVFYVLYSFYKTIPIFDSTRGQYNRVWLYKSNTTKNSVKCFTLVFIKNKIFCGFYKLSVLQVSLAAPVEG